MSFFKQLYDNFEEGACALFVAVMVLCLFLQVAMRIAVGSSLAWTEELSRYSFLWAVYVGAALAVKRGGHVRITAQFMFLPTRWRLVFRAVGDIIWIGFSLYVAWIGLACIEECIIPFSFVLVSWRIVEEYVVRWRNGTLGELVRYEEAA